MNTACSFIFVRGLRAGGNSLLLVGLTFWLAGCGTNSPTTTTTTPPSPSYPSTPAVPITWPISDPASTQLPAPVAQDPANTQWGTGSNDFPLTVSSPAPGASVTSPFNVVATASPTNPIFFMRVYIDNVSVYYTASNSINTPIFAATGKHTLLVMAEDNESNQGQVSAIPLTITVTSQSMAAVSGIQNLPGWQSCGANFPVGSQRAGQLCAAGSGTPASALTQNVSSPSMDGESAQFSMGPSSPDCPHYCNMLYFNPIAGGTNVNTFTYDLYFAIDNPNAPQALEFDLNQGFDDTTANSGQGNPQRFTWGTECNLNGDTPPGQWDIWDDSLQYWVATGISCHASDFQAGAWNHLTWNFHSMGDYVYYDTLTLNGTVYPVNISYLNQPGWDLEEIDAAFQMDLNANGDPYNVYLDEVSLTAQ